MLKKLTLLSSSVATVFAMHSAEININDKDLELGAKFDMGQFNHTVEPNTIFVGVKVLNADGAHSDPEVTDLDPFYEASFLMQNKISNTNLTLGLGVKMNYSAQENVDFMSVPLGIEATYKLPFSQMLPMDLGASLYYAPQVLSMMDGKDYLEYRVQYNVEVIKNAQISLGYRSIDTNYEGIDFNYNQAGYIGFKFRF